MTIFTKIAKFINDHLAIAVALALAIIAAALVIAGVR